MTNECEEEMDKRAIEGFNLADRIRQSVFDLVDEKLDFDIL